MWLDLPGMAAKGFPICYLLVLVRWFSTWQACNYQGLTEARIWSWALAGAFRQGAEGVAGDALPRSLQSISAVKIY
jgi:hypothetical protein